MKRRAIKIDEFNRMVTAILLKYMEWDAVPTHDRINKFQSFNKWLDETTKKLIQNDESIQLSEIEQTEA